ncbi:epidermal growth factor-like protein 7 isoform X2 [Choloepus didactylus]|uniref:epidermal growth factor-like protein 7 isoform X2 n=1 Tax=Choloepus didactylus TaxID=27675 RepID=UPI00189F6432|nr:epidermal growth factor-like protein 7 isoform X2 [Choloepus didactylus]
MGGSRALLLLWFLVVAAGGTEHVYRPGRRVCAAGIPISESFVQRVYQPFLTTCEGHRACSTYRTLYRTAYRRSPGPAPARPRYTCCPGWKRTGRLPGACAADVDECSTRGGGCPQHCVNTAGSYRCRSAEGPSPAAEGTLCLPERGPPGVAPSPTPGVDTEVGQEVRRLQSRVEVLEQVRPGPGCPGAARGRVRGSPAPRRLGGCGLGPRTAAGTPRTGEATHRLHPPPPPPLPPARAPAPLPAQQHPLVAAQGPPPGALPPGGAEGWPLPHQPLPPPEAAAGAGPAARPGLAGPGERPPGRRRPAGPLPAAAGPHRLAERAGLLPGGAAGLLLLQEGAVTRRPGEPVGCHLPAPDCTEPPTPPHPTHPCHQLRALGTASRPPLLPLPTRPGIPLVL